LKGVLRLGFPAPDHPGKSNSDSLGTPGDSAREPSLAQDDIKIKGRVKITGNCNNRSFAALRMTSVGGRISEGERHY
jgi:hypothetical protein